MSISTYTKIWPLGKAELVTISIAFLPQILVGKILSNDNFYLYFRAILGTASDAHPYYVLLVVYCDTH